jgi:spore coat polysaccharide biosynthesis protein SpsF
MFAIFLSVRTGSTRLPKKALYEIKGKTTIEYLIDRLKKSKYAEKVIVCTTELKEDDILCDIAERNDIDYFRGSSPDKLMRWLGATEKYGVDFFVNVDGDDIFFDAELADICFEQRKDVDFIDGQGQYNDVYGVSSHALNMVCESKQSNETEFIKPFFYDIKEYINIQKIVNVPDKYKKRKMRLTLDYEEDFEFFKNVIEHFLDNSKEMEFENVVKYIEENPEVSNINWHREQDWKENQERFI